jgi:SAM-dependent methyltransferase
MDKGKWIDISRKAKRIDKFETIVELCKGKHVLDVGCIGQDKKNDNPKWLHGRIKEVAANLIGVDIDLDGISELKKHEFTIYTPDEIEAYNGKFDYVIMGDVIEHVNDPCQFLEFYSKFLLDEGKMVVCTPNTFGIRYFLQVLIYGKPGTNEEHTLGFDPYIMLELFTRINLKPYKFYWLKEYHRGNNFQQKFILFVSAIFIRIRKYFNSNFMYIIEKA